MYRIGLQTFHEDKWVEVESYTRESSYFDLAKEDSASRLNENGNKVYVFSAERMMREHYKNSCGEWRDRFYDLLLASDTPKQAMRAIESETLPRTTYWEDLEAWVFTIIDFMDLREEISRLEVRFVVEELKEPTSS